MTKSTLSYSQNFETIVALVTYLAVREGRSDAVNAPRLASYLRLDETEVVEVLNHFKGIFRRSEFEYESQDFGHQFNYTLQLRYAHRVYAGKGFTPSGPLDNDDLLTLLEFITNQVREEQENERQKKSNRLTLVGVWTAAALSLASIIVGLMN